MPTIPAKVQARFVDGIKRYQPVLANAKARDVNESDTVVIVADMLDEVFGYDKYEEITSEHAIRGTYCDLAIKLGGSLVLLAEVKAIGLDLKSGFVKQAIDYAANQGVDWVVLTTGALWRVYKVTFTKPIDHELVAEINFLELDPKVSDDLALLWLLAKESWQKEALFDYHAQRQALSRFTLGALILSEPVLETIKKELRKISPDIKIRIDEIEHAIGTEVLKREVLDSEKAEAARKLIDKVAKQTAKAKAAKAAATNAPSMEEVEPAATQSLAIIFACPKCKRQLKAPADAAGRKAKCKCDEILTIPAG